MSEKNQNNENIEFGTAHGRFQPFHLGHLEYVLAAAARCNFLFVGITNPDETHRKPEDTSPNRSKATSNPLTYQERLVVIREALLEYGIQRSRFEIVPFPIDSPELIGNYTPQNARHFTTIFEEWNKAKVQRLKDNGYSVEVLWERPMEDRVATGVDIRTRMIQGRNWEQYVCKSTVVLLKKWDIIDRIKQQSQQELAEIKRIQEQQKT